MSMCMNCKVHGEQFPRECEICITRRLEKQYEDLRDLIMEVSPPSLVADTKDVDELVRALASNLADALEVIRESPTQKWVRLMPEYERLAEAGLLSEPLRPSLPPVIDTGHSVGDHFCLIQQNARTLAAVNSMDAARAAWRLLFGTTMPEPEQT